MEISEAKADAFESKSVGIRKEQEEYVLGSIQEEAVGEDEEEAEEAVDEVLVEIVEEAEGEAVD